MTPLKASQASISSSSSQSGSPARVSFIPERYSPGLDASTVLCPRSPVDLPSIMRSALINAILASWLEQTAATPCIPGDTRAGSACPSGMGGVMADAESADRMIAADCMINAGGRPAGRADPRVGRCG